MSDINELSRIEHTQIVSEHEFWAIYHDIYVLFGKINDRIKLLHKYKKMLKVMRPGKGRAALTFFYRIRRDEIDKQINWNPGVEAILVNETEMFTRGGDPYKKLNIGSHRHEKTDTHSWKILMFIDSFGREGVGLTEIQKYIWVDLNGGSVEDFYRPLAKYKYNTGNLSLDNGKPEGRATRGYWTSNLYGTGRQEGILRKFGERTGTGKWRIRKWPNYYDNLMV